MVRNRRNKLSVKNYSKFAMMMALTTSGLFGDVMGGLNSNTLHNGVSHVVHPWDKTNLSKSERRGKTYEELQAIRKQKYEEAQQLRQPD